MLQYHNNQYAVRVRLQLQYKRVKDEMSRLQMQLASVDSKILPGHQSVVHDRYAAGSAAFLLFLPATMACIIIIINNIYIAQIRNVLSANVLSAVKQNGMV